MNRKSFQADNNQIDEISDKADEIFKSLSKYKKSKNKEFENLICIKAMQELIFLIFNPLILQSRILYLD